jgi:hypothetical protein
MPLVVDPKPRDKKTSETEIPSHTSTTGKSLYEKVIHSPERLYTSTDVFVYYSSLPALSGERVVRDDIRDTLIKLYNMLTWRDGWNGYDACAPESDTVIYAAKWIIQFFLELEEAGLQWIKPSVTGSPEGEVVFEWRNGIKRLIIYIEDHQDAEYMKVWGTDIQSAMSDGEANSVNIRQSLWEWLIH